MTSTYSYDAFNRLTSVLYADGTSATYAYDVGTYAIGHLTRITDATGAYSDASRSLVLMPSRSLFVVALCFQPKKNLSQAIFRFALCVYSFSRRCGASV